MKYDASERAADIATFFFVIFFVILGGMIALFLVVNLWRWTWDSSLVNECPKAAQVKVLASAPEGKKIIREEIII